MSEGITLALPMWAVTCTVARWCDAGNILRIPEFTSCFSTLTPAIAQSRGVAHVGVLCQSVKPDCVLSKLRKGDVVTSLNGWPICARTMRIKTPLAGEVDLDSSVLSLQLPLEFDACIARNGQSLLTIRVAQQAVPVHPMREMYPMWEKVPMCSVGGAVCVPLCKNIIDDFEDYNDSNDVRAAWAYGTTDTRKTGVMSPLLSHMDTRMPRSAVLRL